MSPLLAAGLHFVPGLLWAVIATMPARIVVERRPQSSLFLILFLAGVLMALHYLLFTVVLLIPGHLQGRENVLRTSLGLLIDLGGFAMLAVGRHLARLWPIRAVPPGPGWLAGNYLSALAAGTVMLIAEARATTPCLKSPPFLIYSAFLCAMLALLARELRRAAASGRGVSIGEIRPTDRAAVRIGFACLIGSQLAPLAWGTTGYAVMMGLVPSPAARWMFPLHAAGGVAIALPFVLRDLGEVARAFVTAMAAIAVTAAVYFAVPALAARVADPELARGLNLAAVLGLAAVLLLGRPWVQAAVDRVVLRRRRHRWGEVQEFLHTLTPDLGVVECCARAIGEIARFFRLPRAAILLCDGRHAVHGDFALGSLTRVDAGRMLPPVSFGVGGMRQLPPPLKEALVEAGVIAGIPVASGRQRWGVLLIGPGPVGTSFGFEDLAAAQAVTGQLARVLDAAELLERALVVERALAHAEKLAAIGELAARVAHEIRNPVTAARSLAQQLARAPATPADGEAAALILTELARVERQVAALLRFARRDELRCEPVDVGELVRATVEGFAARLDAAGVGVTLDLTAGVVARADREKVRQVLINLLDNALDALADTAGERRLSVAVGSVNGSATLRVADSGPGVPAELLPRLFEPFFSQKADGTGLGLAIARRTAEAHGGRIEAFAPGTGLTLEVVLPLAGDAR